MNKRHFLSLSLLSLAPTPALSKSQLPLKGKVICGNIRTKSLTRYSGICYFFLDANNDDIELADFIVEITQGSLGANIVRLKEKGGDFYNLKRINYNFIVQHVPIQILSSESFKEPRVFALVELSWER